LYQIERAKDPPMRRYFNVGLLLTTLFFLTIMSVTAWWVRSWQLVRTADVFLARADELIEQSRFFPATEYIQKYLILRPSDREARVRLAEVYATGAANDAEYARATDLLHEAIGVSDKQHHARLRGRLAKILLDLQRFTSARSEAEKMLRANPSDAIALRVRSLALYGQYETGVFANGREDPAIIGRAAFDAIKTPPISPRIAGVLAFVYRELPDLLPVDEGRLDAETRGKRADQVMEKLVDSNPDSPRVHLTRHRYRVRYGLEGQDKDLELAMEKGPKDLETNLTAARYYFARAADAGTAEQDPEFREAFRRAESRYRTILQHLQPKSEDAWVELGELYWLNRNQDLAMACWTSGLMELGKSNLPLNVRLADAAVELQQFEVATKYLTTVNKTAKDLTQSRFTAVRPQLLWIEARILYHKRDFQSSIALLRRIISRETRNPLVQTRARSLLADCYVQLQDWERASIALDELIRHSETTENWMKVAYNEYQRQLSLPAGSQDWSRMDSAIQALQRARDKGLLERPERLFVLQAELLSNSIGKGVNVDLGENPTPDAIAGLIKFLLRYRSPDEASVWVDKLVALDPNSFQTKTLAAKHVYRMGGTPDVKGLESAARVRLKTFSTDQEGSLFASNIGGFLSEVGRLDLAEPWYRKAFSLNPNELGNFALNLASRGKFDQAYALCLGRHHRSDDENSSTLLASILTLEALYVKRNPHQQESGHHQASADIVEKAFQRSHENAELLMAVATWKVTQGDNDTALSIYRELLGRRSQDVVLLNNLASLLVENPETIPEGLRHVNRAISIAGPRPELLDTLGMLLLHSDRAREALPVLEQAVHHNNRDSRFLLHLWAAHYRLGNDDSAKATLANIDQSKLNASVLMSPDRLLLKELDGLGKKLAGLQD
jgi:tetratricopeptide (TPR) repeat protein